LIHPTVELTRRFVASFADVTPSARLGRSLARLMREAGLQNVIGQATVIQVPFGMVRIGFEGHVDKCVQQRLISPQDAERWWQHLKESDSAGEFHCGAIVFTATGEKR